MWKNKAWVSFTGVLVLSGDFLFLKFVVPCVKLTQWWAAVQNQSRKERHRVGFIWQTERTCRHLQVKLKTSEEKDLKPLGVSSQPGWTAALFLLTQCETMLCCVHYLVNVKRFSIGLTHFKCVTRKYDLADRKRNSFPFCSFIFSLVAQVDLKEGELAVKCLESDEPQNVSWKRSLPTTPECTREHTNALLLTH